MPTLTLVLIKTQINLKHHKIDRIQIIILLLIKQKLSKINPKIKTKKTHNKILMIKLVKFNKIVKL